MPIYHEAHWSLVVAEVQNKTVKYYDSLAFQNDECLEVGEVLFYFFYFSLISSVMM